MPRAARFEVGKIRLARGQRRRSDRDKDYVAFAHGLGEVGLEIDAAILMRQRDQLFKTRLVNRSLAEAELLDLGKIRIHARDLMSQKSEARTRYRADISRSYNRYSHCVFTETSL